MKVTELKDIKKNKNWRILIYGKPGVGKTTAVKYLKGKTAILSFDESSKVLEGLDNGTNFDIDQNNPQKDLNDFFKKYYPDVKKDYDNIVLDNVSNLQKTWFTELGKHSHNGISNELQDYNKWTNYFNRLMSMFYEFDGNVLITAWEQQRQVTSETGQTFNQFSPEIRDSVIDNITGLVDVVGRVGIKPDDNERMVIFQGTDGTYAKNRLDNRKWSSMQEMFNFGTAETNKQVLSDFEKQNKSKEQEKVGTK